MIPKIIHFIWWQGADKLPPKYSENVKNWTNGNPSFEVKVWNEFELTKLCEKNYPEYLQNFKDSRHFVEQIDLAKFMLMEIYGGFYVDTDIEYVKPVPVDWLQYRGIFSELHSKDACNSSFCASVFIFSLGHSKQKVFNNGFFAGKPGTGLFKDILREAMKLRKKIPRILGKQIYITYTAGPPFITIYISKYLTEEKDILLLSPTYIEGCGVNFQFSKNVTDCDISKDTVGIHKHGLSWASPIHFFILKCIYHREQITKMTCIFLIFIMIIMCMFWLLK
jgi:mannosyltransferase OCH1-like enzyme